jgi:AcrR family transcriptional regulator
MSQKEKRRPAGGRTYGGRSPEERRAERRERLLEAGLRRFGGEGYASTSIERLCADARVTARHFYEEFPTREMLLLAVFDRVVEHVLKRLAIALSKAPIDVMGRTRHGIEAFVHALLDDPCRARVACLEVVGVSPAIEQHRRNVLRTLANLIESETLTLSDRGLLPKHDYHLSALVLVGGTMELIVEWLARDPIPPVQPLIEELVGIYVMLSEGFEIRSARWAAKASERPPRSDVVGRPGAISERPAARLGSIPPTAASGGSASRRPPKIQP